MCNIECFLDSRKGDEFVVNSRRARKYCDLENEAYIHCTPGCLIVQLVATPTCTVVIVL